MAKNERFRDMWREVEYGYNVTKPVAPTEKQASQNPQSRSNTIAEQPTQRMKEDEKKNETGKQPHKRSFWSRFRMR